MNSAPGTCSCCALPAERRPSRPGGAAPAPARGRQVALCRTKPGAARRTHKAKLTAGPRPSLLPLLLSLPRAPTAATYPRARAAHRLPARRPRGGGAAAAACAGRGASPPGGPGRGAAPGSLTSVGALISNRSSRFAFQWLMMSASLRRSSSRLPPPDILAEPAAAAGSRAGAAAGPSPPSPGRGAESGRGAGGGGRPAGEGPALLSVAAGTGAAETPRDRLAAPLAVGPGGRRRRRERRRGKGGGWGGGRMPRVGSRRGVSWLGGACPLCLPRAQRSRRRLSPPHYRPPLARRLAHRPVRAPARPHSRPPSRGARALLRPSPPRARRMAARPLSSPPRPAPGRGAGAGARPGAVAVGEAAAPRSRAGRQRGAPAGSPAGTKIRRGAVYFPVFQQFGEAALPPAQRRPWLATRPGAERGALPWARCRPCGAFGALRGRGCLERMY